MKGAAGPMLSEKYLCETPRLHPIASGGEHIITPSHERDKERSVYRAKI